jgi:hypothetical protein
LRPAARDYCICPGKNVSIMNPMTNRLPNTIQNP